MNVVVTGLGATTPLGGDVPSTWESALAGRSGVRTLEYDWVEKYRVPITIAGTIGLMIAGWPKMALLPPLSIGYVSLIGMAIMAPLSSLTAPYGAMLAHRLSRRRLEVAFGLFLLLVSARLGASLL